MGKVLVIAEKSDAGRNMAKVLKCDNCKDGYIENEKYIVTCVSDGTLWEVQTALFFRWTCLPDCAVPELAADYRRNNRRLS